MLLVESTYGNRVHPDTDDATLLERVLDETRARRPRDHSGVCRRTRRGGAVLDSGLESRGKVAPVPVYLDSPMAVEALSFYARHEQELDPEVRKGAGAVDPFLSPRGFARSRRRASRRRWSQAAGRPS